MTTTNHELMPPSQTSLPGRPIVFEYDDFKAFLRDMYVFQKKSSAVFSHRYFALKAGYRTSNFLSQVMQGRRNLTADGIRRFAKGLGLSPLETRYFKALVLFNQAGSADERQTFAREILDSKIARELHPLPKARFVYWSRWYHVVIREMLQIPGFIPDPAVIAAALTPPISEVEAAQALEVLETLGFLQRDANGTVQVAEMNVWSGDLAPNECLRQFHRDMAQRGRESIDRFEVEERHVSGVTLTLSPKGAEKVQEMVNQFRKQLLAFWQEDQGHDRVFHVNLQMFPVSTAVSVPPTKEKNHEN